MALRQIHPTINPEAMQPLRVLVVDDEIGYCEKLARFLAAQGYLVLTATNGKDAIRIGATHEPAVLISDWMLCDRIHGLHVIDSVRTIYPATRAVVMTGFASGDLRLEAKTRDACAFIEKPFTPSTLTDAIEALVNADDPKVAYPNFAFIRTDPTGVVTHANAAALTLLGSASDEVEGRPIREVFGASQPLILDHAAMRWVHGVRPTERSDTACVVRARRLLDGSYFVIFADEKDGSMLKYHMSAHLLLDLSDGLPSLRKVSGHGIVVDTDIGARTLVGCVFEELSSICHTTESFARGLELLALDSDVRFVVVDPNVPGDLEDFVRTARSLRPDVLVLGHADRRQLATLDHAGFDKRIAKPWQVSAFVDLLVEQH